MRVENWGKLSVAKKVASTAGPMAEKLVDLLEVSKVAQSDDNSVDLTEQKTVGPSAVRLVAQME